MSSFKTYVDITEHGSEVSCVLSCVASDCIVGFFYLEKTSIYFFANRTMNGSLMRMSHPNLSHVSYPVSHFLFCCHRELKESSEVGNLPTGPTFEKSDRRLRIQILRVYVSAIKMCGYTFGAILALISMIVIFLMVEYRRWKSLTW